MIAFDMDGVLCEILPPRRTKSWGRMNGAERQAWNAGLLAAYHTALPMRRWQPGCPVITARKATPEIALATAAWFQLHYGETPEHIHYLEKARTLENNIAHKARWLLYHGITVFYDDTLPLLRGLRPLLPASTRLVLVRGRDDIRDI